MNRSNTLLLAAVGVLAVLSAAAVVVPGALADRDDPIRPAHLEYRESNVQAGVVTGETVTLRVESRLGHDAGPAENVTLVHRVIDENSGLLVETARNDLGSLDGEREFAPTTNVTVPRDGAYEIRTTVYVDGERRATGQQTVSGVGTLIPDYARTDAAFRAAPTLVTDVPPIPYSIREASGVETALAVQPFVTNTGDGTEDDLELVVQARQTDSNIVADRATTAVGAIEPGRTVQPTVELTIPDEYNYELDAMLRRDGVVVASATLPASLDPSEAVSANVTRRDVGLETSDFERETGRDGPATESNDRSGRTDGQDGPGFGVAAALVAMLAGVTIAARRSS